MCEGFVGNVVLKMAEGMSEVMAGLGKWAFKERFLWRLGLVLLSSGLKQLKSVTDYSEYGGAPLLGFDRLVIKAHGRSQCGALAKHVRSQNHFVAVQVNTREDRELVANLQRCSGLCAGGRQK